MTYKIQDDIRDSGLNDFYFCAFGHSLTTLPPKVSKAVLSTGSSFLIAESIFSIVLKVIEIWAFNFSENRSSMNLKFSLLFKQSRAKALSLAKPMTKFPLLNSQ